MALINIEYGSVASSQLLNDNFNYLEEKIEDYSKNIANDKASLTSLINSQIDTTFVQLTSKINESLQILYPIGSIYIGTTDECPIASLFGTWAKVSEGRVLQGVGEEQKAGDIVEAGLPNITGNVTLTGVEGVYGSGAIYSNGDTAGRNGGHESYTRNNKMGFNASRSNSIYGKSNTVQPPAYLVNIWRRTA